MPEKTHEAADVSPRMKEAREHARAARASMRKSFEELIPHGFIEHRRAARREISAVSLSRISPSMMMSGSWRRIVRRPLANVIPALRLS